MLHAASPLSCRWCVWRSAREVTEALRTSRSIRAAARALGVRDQASVKNLIDMYGLDRDVAEMRTKNHFGNSGRRTPQPATPRPRVLPIVGRTAAGAEAYIVGQVMQVIESERMEQGLSVTKMAARVQLSPRQYHNLVVGGRTTLARLLSVADRSGLEIHIAVRRKT